MKRIIILCLSLALLLACVPTPEEEFVVNKGDGTFEELLLVTAAPQTNKIQNEALEETPAPVSEAFPESWEDLIETAAMNIPIHAEIRTNGHPCPIRKVRRHTISKDEAQTIAAAMLPAVSGVWNSTAYSREEYEEALAALSAQGQAGAAKEIFDEMSDTSLPNEQMESIAEIRIESNDQTFRCENGQYATVSCWGDMLRIDAHRHAVAYSQELLEEDGFYPGCGPILLSPSISQEKAEEILYAFLERVGFEGYSVCEAEKAGCFGILNRTEYSQGWNFYLVHSDEYVPIDMQRHGLGSIFRYESSGVYSAPWHPESMIAYVSENGVESFGWYDPTETVEIVNPDVQLMGFSELQKRIRNMLSAGLSWMADLKAPYGDHPIVKALVLTQTLVPVKDEPDAAYLMPTWVVVSDWYGPGNICDYTDFACFNAVDGSPISLSPERD